jgi:hypothetical protein
MKTQLAIGVISGIAAALVWNMYQKSHGKTFLGKPVLSGAKTDGELDLNIKPKTPEFNASELITVGGQAIASSNPKQLGENMITNTVARVGMFGVDGFDNALGRNLGGLRAVGFRPTIVNAASYHCDWKDPKSGHITRYEGPCNSAKANQGWVTKFD